MEIVLFNKTVNTEAELNDLKLFSSTDDDINGTTYAIDLNNPGEKKIGSQSKRYDHINISSSLLEQDIVENFNFKNILSN